LTGTSPLVLVADDDDDILMLVRATLTAAGYEVVTARDGAAALALLRERTPAAAVLDIAMPLLDGLEVLTQARADSATAELPIVLLSARAQENDVARGYDLGASRYVRKPFSPRELRAVVDELVAGQSGR
jgi:DNA-binding response OmpR family regulator